jgi:pyrroloquinoline quinone biosynthesis protein B
VPDRVGRNADLHADVTKAGTLRILILGAAAGGGFPQWNSNDEASRRARAGDPAARPRTQSSIAVSADGERWVLVNASPDLRQQILDNPHLHPRHGKRHSPIAAVLLTNGDVDHVAGLLTLREGHRFAIYGTRRVLSILGENSIFNVLDPALVARRPIELGAGFAVADASGQPLGIHVEPFAVPGKVALFREDRAAGPGYGTQPEDTIGLALSAGGSPAFYVPGCAEVTPELAARLRGAALLLFDGTLWRDDEMILAGVGQKTGRRMGHVSMSGEEGSLARLAGLGIGRRIFVHVNNSNPALLADSAERAAVAAAGWEVAEDGMEIAP